MRRHSILLLMLAALALPVAVPSRADEAKPAAATATALLPESASTRHEIRIGGRVLSYGATAGTLAIRDAKGERKADIFHVAYRLDGADPARRPIAFAFNGGPGAASAYLHLGALGPRALVFAPDGGIPAPPVQLIDNPDSWLPFTDLVFVDPVGTGYSRAGDGSDDANKAFWGVRQDVEAMAAFIRVYLAHAERTRSPVFLVGESYGGLRAAVLAHHLHTTQGIAVSGVVMVSPALEFSLIYGDDYQPLTWALRLPSFYATVLQTRQGVTPAQLPAALAEAERFALGDFLTGLVSGPTDPARAPRAVPGRGALYRPAARAGRAPARPDPDRPVHQAARRRPPAPAQPL